MSPHLENYKLNMNRAEVKSTFRLFKIVNLIEHIPRAKMSSKHECEPLTVIKATKETLALGG